MITPKEFKQRRQLIMQTIGPDAIALLPAAAEVRRNGDSDYLFRQDSDFYYLTGFKEPEALAVLAPGRKEGEFILFNRPNDPAVEVWVGARAGQKGACEQYGADQSFSYQTIDEQLPSILSNYKTIYYVFGRNPAFDQRVQKWLNQLSARVRAGVPTPGELVDLRKILHEMRLHKSPAEIELMRHVAKVSVAGHQRAMRACRPGLMEYEIEAEINYELTRQGCFPPAYNAIVGAGANSCVLHYNDNNQKLSEGDLLLVDAGGEYQYYAADITRTYPINGRFSAEQRAVYEVVLNAQQTVLNLMKPGTPYIQLQQSAIRAITEGLVAIGLLKGKIDELIRTQAYFAFYMHNIGHWLGLDVHDAGEYRKGQEWRPLEPGMVLTVEPGIYIRPDSAIDKRWWNIGVRIEDDVLVTEQGHDILTKDLEKTVSEIENIMRG